MESSAFLAFDDEYTVIWRRPKAITSDEPSEEPEDPLIMGEKELSTIFEKDKSKSLLSQDIPITSPKIDFLSEEFTGEFTPISPKMDEDEFDEEEVDCYDHDISSDDDSYENIEYVEASPLNLEYDNLEEENEDQEEKDASFFEESDTSLSYLENSLPKFETFSDHTEETRSGSTTTHGEVRLIFLKMLKMMIPSQFSFGFFSRISPTLRFLPYFPPPEMRTPASSLRAGGISSGWNFQML
ncbi:hypothetical protein Tco_0837735 [Tanacetum coccineum]